MDENQITEYFKNHKLSRTGIRNFLMYQEGAREFVSQQLSLHSEYDSPGGYIACLVSGIALPKCVICGKVIHYNSYRNGHTHCSMECFAKDKNVVDKRSNTAMNLYGVENVSQAKHVKDKRTATIMERYGVDSILKNKDYVAKQKQTMIERYGVDSWQKTEERKKSEYSMSYQTILGWKDYVVPMFTEEEYHGYKHNEIYKWKCVKCGNEFEDKIGGHGHLKLSSKIPRCWKCYPQMTNESISEREVIDFIKSIYNGEIRIHDRNLLDGIEIDVYIPEFNVAIEFDGLFFHNELSGKDKNYHLTKTMKCEVNGVRLVHIFEDEWNKRREAVKGMIKSILNIGLEEISFIDCRMEEISVDKANEFLDKNCIFGSSSGLVSYGLFYKNELVLAMLFDKNNGKWELKSMATKTGMKIHNGYVNVLEYFEKSYSEEIVAYMDRRYPINNIYEEMGFEFVSDGEPRFWWCNKIRIDNLNGEVLSRLLKKKYDSSKTDEQNLIDCGWSRIFDCGKRFFVKKYPS